MHRFIFLAFMGWALPTSAAEIVREPSHDGIDTVSIRGTFEEGDDAQFRKVAATIDRAVVILDSGGGNLQAGLEIGRAIKLRGFATAVPPSSLCASACLSPGWLDRPVSWTRHPSSVSTRPAKHPNPDRRTRLSARISTSSE